MLSSLGSSARCHWPTQTCTLAVKGLHLQAMFLQSDANFQNLLHPAEHSSTMPVHVRLEQRLAPSEEPLVWPGAQLQVGTLYTTLVTGHPLKGTQQHTIGAEMAYLRGPGLCAAQRVSQLAKLSCTSMGSHKRLSRPHEHTSRAVKLLDTLSHKQQLHLV